MFFLWISRSTITSVAMEFRLKMVAPGFNPNNYLQLDAITSCIISVQKSVPIAFLASLLASTFKQTVEKTNSFHYTAFTTG
jgi:hypothetical protein